MGGWIRDPRVPLGIRRTSTSRGNFEAWKMDDSQAGLGSLEAQGDHMTGNQNLDTQKEN
jgi:hypothetical protein